MICTKLAPVRRFPPGVLIEALEARKKEEDLVAVFQEQRNTPTSVSRPSTKVDFGYPEDLVCRCLERSGKNHIDVAFEECSALGPTERLVGPTPWLARMKSLYIQRNVEQIQNIVGSSWFSREAPELRSLTIEGKTSSVLRGRDSGIFHLPPNFLGGSAPVLQSLKLKLVSPDVVFPFPLPMLTHVEWVAPTTHVAIEELLDLFATSPMLEDIKLHVLVRRQEPEDQPLREVTLNELRKLNWADYDGWTTPIPFLIAPKLRELQIRVTTILEHHQTTSPSILPDDGDRIPLLQDEPLAVEYACINRKTQEASYCFDYPGNAYLSVTEVIILEPGRINYTIDWLPPDSNISFSSTQKLTLKADGEYLPPCDQAIPIREFLGLQSLNLEGDIDRLVSLVGLDYTLGDRRSTSFPSIPEVRIVPSTPCFNLNGFLQSLGQRARAGCQVNTFHISTSWPNEYTHKDLRQLEQVVDRVIIT